MNFLVFFYAVFFKFNYQFPGQLRSVVRAIYVLELLYWSAGNHRPNIIELRQLTINWRQALWQIPRRLFLRLKRHGGPMDAYIGKAAISWSNNCNCATSLDAQAGNLYIIGACCRIENWRFNSNLNSSKLLKLAMKN